jgi:hypothetical protein
MFQRQVYIRPAPTAEADRRNADVVTHGRIWAGEDEIAWIENGDVFSITVKQEFATLGPVNIRQVRQIDSQLTQGIHADGYRI